MRPKHYHGSKHHKSGHGILSVLLSFLIVIILVVVFVFAVYWFRKPAENVEATPEQNNHPEVSTPVTDAIKSNQDKAGNEALLHDVTGGSSSAVAKRGVKDDKFYVEVTSQLSSIDRQLDFYEIWLLRRVPFEFFSIGEMITNDEGVFYLEWEGEKGKDYSDYTEVIITLEKYENNADPEKHIVEGEFEKVGN